MKLGEITVFYAVHCISAFELRFELTVLWRVSASSLNSLLPICIANFYNHFYNFLKNRYICIYIIRYNMNKYCYTYIYYYLYIVYIQIYTYSFI